MSTIWSNIIVHGQDLDGIVAGALGQRHIKNYFTRHFVTYAKQVKFFEELAEKSEKNNNNFFFIADLNCNEKILPACEKIAGAAQSVIWIDHHEGTEANRQELLKMGIIVVTNSGEKICASQLIAQKFLPADAYGKFIAHLAQLNDYPENESDEMVKEISAQLQNIIMYFNAYTNNQALESLTVALATTRNWQDKNGLNASMRETLDKCHAVMEQAKINLRQRGDLFAAGEKKYFISYGDAIIYSKETMRELTNENRDDVDGFIVVFGSPVNNALFFKNRPADLTAMQFCKQMGGGGREGGGGFAFNYDINFDNYLDVKKVIIGELQKFFVKR